MNMATEHHSADAGGLKHDAQAAARGTGLHSKHAGHGKAVTHVKTLARLKPATHGRKKARATSRHHRKRK